MIITVIGFLDRRNVTNMFIINLSVGDVLAILFALPLKVKDSPVLLYCTFVAATRLHNLHPLRIFKFHITQVISRMVCLFSLEFM